MDSELARGSAIEAVTEAGCSGCGGCEDACPSQAVRMTLSAEGFYRPTIDSQLCNACGLCRLHCPVLSPKSKVGAEHRSPKVFGGWANFNKERNASASGGIAFALASKVVAEHGVVAGCAFDDDLLATHRLIETTDGLRELQGSKYLPSKPNGIYQRVVREASRGRKTLFTGTPCQVAALNTFLRPSFRENVITADLVCFGVPSILPWRKHLAESFEVPVRKVCFRDKSAGWSNPRVRYTLANGKDIFRMHAHDAFVAGFRASAFHQPICHQCPFAKLPRQGDLTLGDFWGVPSHRRDERGVSVVVVSTTRGVCAIRDLQETGSITLFESEIEIATPANPRLIGCGPNRSPHPRRDEIFKRLLSGERLDSVSTVYKCSSRDEKWSRLDGLYRVCKQALRLILPNLLSASVKRASSVLLRRAVVDAAGNRKQR